MSRDKLAATSMAAAQELRAPQLERESRLGLPEPLLARTHWLGLGQLLERPKLLRSPEWQALPQPRAPSAFRASHDRRTWGAFRRPAGVRGAWAGQLRPPA